MVRPGRSGAGLIERVASAGLAVALLLVVAFAASPPAAAQTDPGTVRIVHGVSDLGPIDVYIDGRLAVVGATFPSATDPLTLAAGDHRIAATASGSGLNAAIIDSALTVEPGTSADIAVVGSAADMPAILFPVDTSSLDADRARLRVVHGSADAGPLDVSFVGGDAIFPTVEYRAASEYAEVPAGTYALDVRAPGAELPTITLPDLVLAPGEVADVYVVGQVADATIQPLVVRTAVAVTPLVGRAVTLREGTCTDPGAVVATLGIATRPRGADVGSGGGEPIENGFGSAPVAFDAAVAAPHLIAIGASEADDAEVVACGPIAGSLTDDGALAIALNGAGGDPRGVAVIAPGVLDPSAIDVSVFLLPAPETSPALPAADDDGGETTAPGDAGGVSEIAPATPAPGA